MGKKGYEIVIVGAGMVGQSIAYQLIDRKISSSIVIIGKEKFSRFSFFW